MNAICKLLLLSATICCVASMQNRPAPQGLNPDHPNREDRDQRDDHDVPPARRPRLDPPANGDRPTLGSSSDSDEEGYPVEPIRIPIMENLGDNDIFERSRARGRGARRNRGLGRNGRALIDSPDDVSTESSSDSPPMRIVGYDPGPSRAANHDQQPLTELQKVYLETMARREANSGLPLCGGNSTSRLNMPRKDDDRGNTSMPLSKKANSTSESSLSDYESSPDTTVLPDSTQVDDDDKHKKTESDVKVIISNYTERIKKSNNMKSHTSFNPKPFDPYTKMKSRNREQYETCRPSDDVVYELNNYKIDVDRPIWHHYTFETGSYNREELQINEVVAEKSFTLNDRQIIEWISLNHYAIGRGNYGLTLVASHPDGIHVDNLEYDESISSLSIFQWWNKDVKALCTGLLTAQTNIIKWHWIDGYALKEMWSWPLTSAIVHMEIFKFDDSWKVAITHEQNGAYSRAVSIYGLDLWENWWFEQKVNGYGKPVIINNGKLLAVLLENEETIAVYKYDYNTRKYIEFKNLTSPEIKDMKSFVIGSSSFLAIAGENPAIYEIRGTEFVEKYIEHYNLKHVEHYLPISLGYYRNDAIVLFQHKLDHYTHSSSVLEALQWNGEKFSLLDHSPCKSHDEEMFGFSCILDAEGEKGIKGAAVFKTIDDNVNILTASEEYTPIMFEIKTELINIPNPLESEVEELLRAKDSIQERFERQCRVLENAEKIAYSNTILNEDVFTADNWKIKEIHAPSVRIDGDIQASLYEGSTINVAGQDWSHLDLNTDTSHLFDQIRSNHDRLKNIMNKLKYAIMKSDGLPATLVDVDVSGDINVKGEVYVKNSRIDNLNGLNVDSVFENAVKKGKDGKLVISGDVTVENINAKNINVKYVNGLNVIDDDLQTPFIVYGDLEIHNRIHIDKDVDLTENGMINSINFKKDLYTPYDKQNLYNPSENCLNFDSIIVNEALIAKGTVNGYNFTKEAFDVLLEEKRINDNKNIMKRDALTLETLSVGHNLYFDNINGRSWKNYTEALVMTDDDTIIDDLIVDGTITLDDTISMNFLNNLTYPSDYLLLNESSSIFISASKTFANGLQAVEVDCEETINGIAPHNIVTLSTRQNLNNFTFFDLTVTERMNVQGEITGRELDAFLSNPLLKEVNTVKSRVIFRNLRVNGTVSIQNKINGSDWDNLFAGVIMKTDNAMTIDSFKSFDGHVFVKNGVNIKSGFIKNRHLSEFFTLDTDQIIANEILSGNISLENLRIEGTFDGVNITELNANSVKLSGDQIVTSNMIFDDDEDVDYDSNSEIGRSLFPLNANDIEITQKCNDWNVPDDLIFLDDDVVELHSPQFDNLIADKLIIDGNLESTRLINGIDLDYFNSVRLSKTEKKHIIAPYTILNCTIDSLDFHTLNGMTKNDIEIINEKMNNIDEEILNGNVDVDTLHVSGILNVSKINDVDLRQVAEDAIWLKENSDIKTHLIFNDRITMKKLYLNGNAYDVHFDSYISDLVKSYDDFVELKGNKIYVNGLEIQGNITTHYMNDIEVSNILTFHEDQIVHGDVYVSGNLNINENLHTENDIMNDLSKSFKYIGYDEYQLTGDFILSHEDVHIYDLIVDGLINGIRVNDVLESAASIAKDNYFDNTIVFMKPVTINNDLSVLDTYNGINMNHFLNDLVMINAETFINSSVVFERPLTVDGNLYVHDDLSCNYMQNCDVNEWKLNAIYLNEKQIITGVKEFKNLTIKGNAYVKNLNGISFDKFVTLNTDQVIGGNFIFNTIHADSAIGVSGFVNDVRLDEEYHNTLMINSDQTIESLIHFHMNVTVFGNANIKNVNSKDMNDVVTLDSDQTLHAQYNFYGETVFEDDLNIAGDISEIDFDAWIRNAVFTNDYGKHIIRGKWYTNGDIVFGNNLTGTGTIDGLNTDDLNKYLQIRERVRQHNENNFRYQYKRLCDGINYFTHVLNTQIYKFNYFDEIQSISSVDFSTTYHFVYNGSNYIVMSDKWNCKGYLWKWNASAEQFKKINRVEMGCPIKWHIIRTKKSFYLLSIAGLECQCKVSGTNIWSFDGINLQFIKTMAPVESIFVLSNEYGSYYAIKQGTVYKYIIQDQVDKFDVIQTQRSQRIDAKLKIMSGNNFILTDGKNLLKYSDEKLTTLNMKNEIIYNTDETIDLYVGKTNRHLIAAAWTHDPNNNESIIIYEDLFEGSVFQRIPCNNPSSLATIRLGGYQTLLLFVESHKSVQVYSYHGFQGFKRLYSLDIRADSLEFINIGENAYLAIAGDGVLSIAKVIMYGRHINRISICDNLQNL